MKSVKLLFKDYSGGATRTSVSTSSLAPAVPTNTHLIISSLNVAWFLGNSIVRGLSVEVSVSL